MCDTSVGNSTLEHFTMVRLRRGSTRWTKWVTLQSVILLTSSNFRKYTYPTLRDRGVGNETLIRLVDDHFPLVHLSEGSTESVFVRFTRESVS